MTFLLVVLGISNPNPLFFFGEVVILKRNWE